MRDVDERPTTRSAAVADEETTDVTSERLGPGTELGGYIIDGVLGHGGMGIVYAATHPLIGKRAAAKVLKPELSKEPAAVERFVREARAVNQIGHPNIVDIYDFGQLPDGRSYYLMDLLDGEPLRAKLKRGALHVAEAACVIDETASALSAAHDKGIIHRDLKPDNVFMVETPGRWPEVRLLDWGLAKLVRGGGKFQTVTGSVLGTPVYMSPEQARGEQVDHRTDIYALGVMSYELLAGAVPFKRGSSVDTLLAHQEDPVPPLAPRVPDLPDELAQLIEAMLAKSADDRPTLAAVRAVLKRLRGTKIPMMTAAGLKLPRTISSDLQPAADASLSMQLTVPRLPAADVPPASPSAQIPALPPPPSYQMAAQPYPLTPNYSPSTPMSMQGVPPSYGPAYSPRPPSTPPYAYAQGSLPPQFPSAAGLLPPRAQTAPPAPSRRWVVIAVAAVVATAIGIIIALLI
ncbi:MAG: protein kinase [Deltaproteobacteria bacterium]|nr:protein kinase [Deltaproteobacteria bacterium]